MKFSLGIAQAGLGFGALVYGAASPDEAGLVAAYWMVLAYLLHTTGELCLSPVGLSAVTKLAVPSVVGVMMGAWFLATAYSEFVAAQLAKLAAIETVDGAVADQFLETRDTGTMGLWPGDDLVGLGTDAADYGVPLYRTQSDNLASLWTNCR